MAEERDAPTPPPTPTTTPDAKRPFEDASDWASDLDAWDASLPIVEQTPSPLLESATSAAPPPSVAPVADLAVLAPASPPVARGAAASLLLGDDAPTPRPEPFASTSPPSVAPSLGPPASARATGELPAVRGAVPSHTIGARGDGESSSALFIPDVEALAAGPRVTPARATGAQLAAPRSASPEVRAPGAPPATRRTREPSGRLITEDGLPDLSGVYSTDERARTTAPSPSRKAPLEDPDDVFLGELAPESPVSFDLGLGGNEPSIDPLAIAGDQRLRDEGRPAPLSATYLRDLALLLAEELSRAQTRPLDEVSAEELCRLACAAAAAHERHAPEEALRLYEEALGVDPGYLPALRGRWIVSLRAAERSEAVVALEALADQPGPEAGPYRIILSQTEAVWATATALPGAGSAGRDLAPAEAKGVTGLAALLLEVERALRQGATARASAGLDALAGRLGGGAGDTCRAVAVAARATADVPAPKGALDLQAGAPTAPKSAMQILAVCTIVRLASGEAIGALDGLLAQMAPSPLKVAVARWAANLARARFDRAGVYRELQEAAVSQPGVPLPFLERMDLLVARAAVDDTLAPAEALGALEPAPSLGRALFCWRLARALEGTGRIPEALETVRRGLDARPSAVPLALLAERLADKAADGAQVEQALALWAAGDLARRPAAHLARAQALRAVGGSAHNVLEALRAAAAAAPGDPVFWWLSLALAHGRDLREAAEQLERGASAWEATAAGVAAALRARAVDLRRAGNPREFVAALPPTPGGPVQQDDPATLARLAGGAGADPTDVAAAFCSAARVGSPLRLLEAAGWLVHAGVGREALSLLIDGGLRSPVHAAALSRLLSFAQDAGTRVELLGTVDAQHLSEGAGGLHDLHDLHDLRLAEAFEAAGRGDEALRTLAAQQRRGDAVAAGSFIPEDVFLASRRLLWRQPIREALEELLLARGAALEAAGPSADRRAARVHLERGWILVHLRGGPELALVEAEAARALAPGWLEPIVASVSLAARSSRFDVVAVTLASLAPAALRQLAPRVWSLAASLDEARGQGAEAVGWLSQAASLEAGAPMAVRRALVERLVESLEGSAVATRAALLEAAAEQVSAGDAGDRRLGAILLLRAAELRPEPGDAAAREKLLRRALWLEPEDLPALAELRRLLVERGAPEALEALEIEARASRAPGTRAELLLAAAELAEGRLSDRRAAADLLVVLLELLPEHEPAFVRLRALLTALDDATGLASALARRIAVAPPDEAQRLRAERADLLGKGGDRPGAKAELRALLELDPQNVAALARLAALEVEDGAHGVAAELYIRQARYEREPERLEQCFLQIGRLAARELGDAKLAIGAYDRVLRLKPDHREALEALSDLCGRAGDVGRALQSLEKLLELEREPAARLPFLLRASSLWEKSGDSRRAMSTLKRACEESPRSLTAVSELAAHLERNHEVQARNILLDTSLRVLREDMRSRPSDLGALRTMVPLLRLRQRPASALAAAQLLGALSPEPSDRLPPPVTGTAAAGGRRLAPLANPALDERTQPASLPMGLRHVLGLAGPGLRKAARPDLKRWSVGKAERVGAGSGPRQLLDGLASDLGVREFEVYVTAAHPNVFAVESAEEPVIILGSAVAAGAPAGLRFAAGYCLRLCQSYFDLFAAGPHPAGALLAGLIRQGLPGYEHPELEKGEIAEATSRVTRATSRSVRAEMAPFVAELASPFSCAEVHGAMLESAARVGLMASGDLAASLAVLLAAGGASLSPEALVGSPLAAALIDFALGEDHEQLGAALEAS